MKYHGYDVDSAFVEGSVLKWKLTGNGVYLFATKGGNRYFVKRNNNVRYPQKDLPPAVYDGFKKDADYLENKQKTLKSLMKGMSWTKDHIVVEEEHFWDEDNLFTTITALIPDILPDDYDYTTQSLSDFLGMALNATEIFCKLHKCGVIHGDLKLKNFVVRQESGKYVPYLLDFDSSYPKKSIPTWDRIGGSPGWQSPEIMVYAGTEDETLASTITSGTDIFTLGIVFHHWWGGSFPGIDIDGGCVAAAVYMDKPVIINKKFDVKIGPNNGATLMSLINWMFAKEPEKRPTAEQVKQVLQDELCVPDEYQIGSDEKPFKAELWTVHSAVAELLAEDALKKLGLKGFTKINEGSGSTGLKYLLKKEDGTESILSIDELISGGYATRRGAAIDGAWPEHNIELVSAEEISAKGYAKIEKSEIFFRKKYRITTSGGRSFEKGYEWLLAEGLAKAKVCDTIDTDTPWPEHGTEYVKANMAMLGVKSISRMEIAGEHRYKIVYEEIVDGKNKVNERVPVSNLRIMGFIK